jgi:hypothetical protein
VSSNPILALRDTGFERDTGRSKIGDGVKAWNDLNYFNEASAGGGGGGIFDHDGVVAGHRVGVGVNRWYTQATKVGDPLVNTSVVMNMLRAFPFIPSKDMTLDKIALNLTFAGSSAGAEARCGVYNDDGNLYPSSLIVDGGGISTNGSTGLKVASILAPLEGGKLYWLAECNGGNNPNARGVNVNAALPILGFDSTLGINPGVGWEAPFVYAALPANYPAGAVVLQNVNCVAIFVRGT